MKSIITFTAFVFAAACASSLSAQNPTNREVMDRFIQTVDSKEPQELAEIETPDVVITNPLGKLSGAAHQQLISGFIVAFPNLKHTITRCVEQGDLIACEGKFIADHTGPLAMADGSTLPATNKHVEFGWGSMASVRDGKLAELNVYFDVLNFLGQLGIGPGATK